MVANLLRVYKQNWRRALSAVMLVLFALSITPRKTLHDWIVDHQDETGYHHTSSPLIVKSGFHCDTENSVAESPFTGEAPVEIPLPLPAYTNFNHAVSSFVHTSSPYYFSLRGPPATV